MEVTNMSIEKQMLYNEIDELPEELTRQVFNFIEYLKMSYIDSEAPDSIKIKSKKDKKNEDLLISKDMLCLIPFERKWSLIQLPLNT